MTFVIRESKNVSAKASPLLLFAKLNISLTTVKKIAQNEKYPIQIKQNDFTTLEVRFTFKFKQKSA